MQAVAVVLLLIFTSTRVLNFGTHSSNLIPLRQHDQIHLNPLLYDWRTFVYTCKYPPDLSYWTLWTAAILLILAGCEAIPKDFKERIPIIVYGRAPFFFFVRGSLCVKITIILTYQTYSRLRTSSYSPWSSHRCCLCLAMVASRSVGSFGAYTWDV